MTRRHVFGSIVAIAGVLAALTPAGQAAQRSASPRPAAPAAVLRPPAVPLVAHDPYFSIWSPADRLTDTATVHWTGRPQNLRSLVRIDGKTYRLMGPDPKEAPALPQTSLTVLPTRTVYTFANEQARVTLTFTSPL